MSTTTGSEPTHCDGLPLNRKVADRSRFGAASGNWNSIEDAKTSPTPGLAPEARCQKPTPSVRDCFTAVELVRKPHEVATFGGTVMDRSAATQAADNRKEDATHNASDFIVISAEPPGGAPDERIDCNRLALPTRYRPRDRPARAIALAVSS